jgi:hypothetical protein
MELPNVKNKTLIVPGLLALDLTDVTAMLKEEAGHGAEAVAVVVYKGGGQRCIKWNSGGRELLEMLRPEDGVKVDVAKSKQATGKA